MENLNFNNETTYLLNFREKEAWKKLSGSTQFPWSEKIILQYKDHWDWDELSENISIPWSINLLEQIKDKINWKKLPEGLLSVRFNSGHFNNLSYTEDILSHFEDLFDWNEISDSNLSIPFQIIHRFRKNFNWKELIHNRQLDWTFEQFLKLLPYLKDIELKNLIDSHLMDELVEQEQKILEGRILFQFDPSKNNFNSSKE